MVVFSQQMRRRQRGVALAIVVWFIAGMAVLVAGIVSLARVDNSGTQLHLAKAKVVAAGDGAINLAMVERSAGFDAEEGAPLVSQSFQQVGDLRVRVLVYPADGFIDLNYASQDILAALFQFAGKLPSGEAQNLADNVVKWRSRETGARRTAEINRFYSIEDLLRVEGVTRTLIDGLRDFVIPGDWKRGGVDWSASPQELFSLLQSVSPELAEKFERRRAVLAGSGGTGRRSSSMGGNDMYRVDAFVEYGGRTWLRRRWMRLASSRNSSLPWTAMRTEAPRVVTASL